jgi:hypothetical protein
MSFPLFSVSNSSSSSAFEAAGASKQASTTSKRFDTHTQQQQQWKEAEPAPMSTATNQRTKFERATFNERRTNE